LRFAETFDDEKPDYRYKDGNYHDAGCYDASWTVTEGDIVRELKEPQITPCGQR
jgi:hypothetical protein